MYIPYTHRHTTFTRFQSQIIYRERSISVSFIVVKDLKKKKKNYSRLYSFSKLAKVMMSYIMIFLFFFAFSYNNYYTLGWKLKCFNKKKKKGKRKNEKCILPFLKLCTSRTTYSNFRVIFIYASHHCI